MHKEENSQVIKRVGAKSAERIMRVPRQVSYASVRTKNPFMAQHIQQNIENSTQVNIKRKTSAKQIGAKSSRTHYSRDKAATSKAFLIKKAMAVGLRSSGEHSTLGRHN